MELEKKAPFPFNMIEKMMPMYPLIALVGWLMVLISFLIGLLVLSPSQAAFFSDAKAVREGAAIGSRFVNANLTIHVIQAWLPQFKFLGLGLGLMAITMALGAIVQRLRKRGKVITSHFPGELRPPHPPIPGRVKVFQLATLMSIAILMAALLIGVFLAAGVVPAYWNHSIADALNPAQVGSALLRQLGVVNSFAKWLNPLRMVGMSLLFTGITIALTVIIGILRMQQVVLARFYRQANGS